MRISDWSSDVCSSDLTMNRYDHLGCTSLLRTRLALCCFPIHKQLCAIGRKAHIPRRPVCRFASSLRRLRISEVVHKCVVGASLVYARLLCISHDTCCAVGEILERGSMTSTECTNI